MIHQLRLVGGDHFLATVLALHRPTGHVSSVMPPLAVSRARGMRTFGIRYNHTIEVGLGALTGRPLALTGARVPAFSAALCSRWTYARADKRDILRVQRNSSGTLHTLAFLEIGMIAVKVGVVVVGMLRCAVLLERRFSMIALIRYGRYRQWRSAPIDVVALALALDSPKAMVQETLSSRFHCTSRQRSVASTFLPYKVA